MTASGGIIQISLGGSSNAVTAHTLNLQGLAATDEDCETSVTHRTYKNYWVPRCIFVDEPSRYFATQSISQMNPLYTGVVPQGSFPIEPLETSFAPSHSLQSQWSQQYQSTASSLAYSLHSRYFKESSNDMKYQVCSQNSRHVDWDDLDGKEEEEKEESEERQLLRQQQQRAKWERETRIPLQTKLDELVGNRPKDEDLKWTEFLMPPFDETCMLATEQSHQSQLTPNWDAYGSIAKHWTEEILFERLRKTLEAEDTCQGFILATEGHGAYAGLTTALLREMLQEAKSASRLIFHITNPLLDAPQTDEEDQWQPAHVKRVRQNISSGLSLFDFSQHADAVVPLCLPEGNSFFERSAKVAQAVEACTLPIRIALSKRIGLTNFGGEYDMPWGSTAQRLSMAEYIRCLQPSSVYKILELDILREGLDIVHLTEALWQGTSLERDARSRDFGNSRTRVQDVPPGKWVQDERRGGLLTSLSPGSDDPRFGDRSLHRHFAFGAMLRPPHVKPSEDPRYRYDPSSRTLEHYLTATIQGTGISYRPERSMACVGSRTIGQMAYGEASGGAGAYWKSLVTKEQPGLSFLGNSTRCYGHLDNIASNMKLSLGPRYRGFHQRDIVNGVLPESEDCVEALEGCFDLRDAYNPPEGSGLVGDADDDF